MRGSIVERGASSYALVLDLGYQVDPGTGARRRKQKWVTFRPARGTQKREARKQAEAKLTELLGQVDTQSFIEPSRATLIEWLRSWLDTSIKPLRRANTYRIFKSVIESRVAPSWLASVPLQKLDTAHLEKFYAEQTDVAPATIAVYHALIRSALSRGVKSRLLVRNVAKEGVERPKPGENQTARVQCWTAAEARKFLQTVTTEPAQTAAFFALALDSGARKKELVGLRWADLDLDAGKVTIAGQLAGITGEGAPLFGVTKTGRTRVVTLGAQTVSWLRDHKRQQAALKLKNRTHYADHGLVFAKEARDQQTATAKLGEPITSERLARYDFDRLTTAADVRRIVFHGLRHTSATLLLQAGEPVHVVSQRLGHKKSAMTLDVYAHAMPDQQATAAERLGALLHG